jgi:DNA-binding NtrC family response regulator
MSTSPGSILDGAPDVLIADGDQAAGRLLARQFEKRGFSATHTACGEQVLSLAHAGRLRVVIVDVTLDDMSGHVLVSRLKEVAPSLRVLMTTSDYRPEFEVRAREIGIVHYAQKPTQYTRLEAIVTRAIGAGQRA